MGPPESGPKTLCFSNTMSYLKIFCSPPPPIASKGLLQPWPMHLQIWGFFSWEWACVALILVSTGLQFLFLIKIWEQKHSYGP